MSQSAPPRADLPILDELPLVITTPRLRLRPIAQTDLEALWPHVSDPEVARMMSWAAHADREETRTFIQRQVDGRARGTDLTWVIEHEGTAQGVVGLGGIQWTFRAWRLDRAELGYWLGKPLWNQGFMSEAALAATQWAFETLGLHKVTIGCIDGNHASKRVIEKIGYRFLAVHEDDVWRDGRWWSHLRWELTAAEWADSARTMRFNKLRPL